MKITSPQYAHIEWQNNQPFSSRYGDVYFSTDNGLLETEYVFLAGNQLEQRWRQEELKTFTIIETGFGSGLNFLAAANLWLKTAPINATLHFISIEKYPLSAADLASTHSVWPSLHAFSKQLIHSYQTIQIDQPVQTFPLNSHLNITLTLVLTDVEHAFAHIHAQADAWFLDGFAPAKNPDMWQSHLFNNMAKHSHSETTFATFTSAGIVRRGLINAGFIVNKQPGFGKKREMLTGRFSPQLARSNDEK